MRKFAVLFVLLALVLSSLQAVTAQQTRPRRVGQSAPAGSTPQTPSTTPPTAGARPPVLSGANNSTSRTASAPQPTPGKDEPIELGEGDTLRINTNLVTVPVSVLDRNGKYVPNLRKEDFKVYEDGVQQEVAYFASVEKPFTVALLLDTSVSTRNNLMQIQDEAIAFVDQLRPDDRVMVVSFDNRVRVLSEPTSDRYQLRNAIRMTEPHSGTKLYDAIDLVINQRFNRISGRKAIVIFTDGVDTTSRVATYESTVRDAEELDALIYPIRFDTYDATRGALGGGGGGGIREITIGGITIRIPDGGGGGDPSCTGCSRAEYERGEAYLHELAQRTGTRVEEAGDGRNLSQAFAIIAEELRRQYSIGYYPNNQAQAGQRRQIRVRVNRPNMAVRARDSYILSDQQSSDQYQNAPQQPQLKNRQTATSNP